MECFPGTGWTVKFDFIPNKYSKILDEWKTHNVDSTQTFSTEASTLGSGSGSGLSVSIGSLAGFSSEVEGAGSVTKRIK